MPLKNRENRKAFKAAWYQKNKKRLREHHRNYKRINQEKVKAWSREAYLKLKAARKAAQENPKLDRSR